MDLLAQFVSEGCDERIFRPPLSVCREDLPDSGTGDLEGFRDVGLARPHTSRLIVACCHAEQRRSNVPLGLLFLVSGADDALFEGFEGGRADRPVTGRRVFGPRKFGVWEPVPKTTEE